MKLQKLIDEIKVYLGFWDIDYRESIGKILEKQPEFSKSYVLTERLSDSAHRFFRQLGLTGIYCSLFLCGVNYNKEYVAFLGVFSGMSLLLDKATIKNPIEDRLKELELFEQSYGKLKD